MRDLAPNVDMISLLGEYIGIPFAQFSQSSTPDPADPWTVTASAMALEATTSGKPIMLQLALSRESVVGEVHIALAVVADGPGLLVHVAQPEVEGQAWKGLKGILRVPFPIAVVGDDIGDDAGEVAGVGAEICAGWVKRG